MCHTLPAPRKVEEIAVEPGDDLRAILAACPPGARLLLLPGAHAGPIALTRPVHIRGAAGAVLRSRDAPGEAAVTSSAADAALSDLSIESVGGNAYR